MADLTMTHGMTHGRIGRWTVAMADRGSMAPSEPVGPSADDPATMMPVADSPATAPSHPGPRRQD